MAVVHKSVLLPFSVEQMFKLVDKVEDYPAFLPWCGGVEVRERDADRLVASIQINYHGVKQTFATENLNTPPTRMTMKLVEGPFRQLDFFAYSLSHPLRSRLDSLSWRAWCV